MLRARPTVPLRFLALVAVAVALLVGCGDGEASQDTDARSQIEEDEQVEGGEEVGTNFTIRFDGTSFSLEEFRVPVDTEISVTFDNATEGVEANLEFEGIEGASTEPSAGPHTEVLGFTVEDEGEYTYRCTACPGEVTGTMTAVAGYAG